MTQVFTRVRWRMLTWTMLVVILILVLVGVTAYGSVQRSLTRQLDSSLIESARSVAGRMNRFGGGRIDPGSFRPGAFYLLTTPDGHILDNPQRLNVDTFPLAGTAEGRPGLATIRLGDEPVRVFVLPVTGERGNRTVLVAGQSMLPMVQALHSFVEALLISAAAGLLLSFAGAWFLVGRSLVPIQLAYQRQQEFTADAAHELRTPLTVLHATTDILQQHRDEPLDRNAELFDDMRHEILRMEQMTVDLLTLARSDRGELELAVAEVDLNTVAVNLGRQVRPLAQERELTVSVNTHPEPVIVEADPNRVQQVLLIVLDNAMKHTPPGGRVDVRVGLHGKEAEVAVSDTGEGIASEHLDRLFDRFYRVDASRSRDSGGSGLGLAIARSLISAHGGHLSVTSTVGVGTRVLVRLPVGAPVTSLSERLGTVGTRLAHVLRR